MTTPLRLKLEGKGAQEFVLDGFIQDHVFLGTLTCDGVQPGEHEVEFDVSAEPIEEEAAQLAASLAAAQREGKAAAREAEREEKIREKRLEAAKLAAEIEALEDGVDDPQVEVIVDGADEVIAAVDTSTAAAEPPAPEEKPSIDPVHDRHAQIPEPAWNELNLEQKEDVLETVARMERLARVHAESENPTDLQVAGDRLVKLRATLKEDFGIELLELEEVPEVAANEPPPPPSTDKSSESELRRRRSYLRTRTGLPAEAVEARNQELSEIAERLDRLQEEN